MAIWRVGTKLGRTLYRDDRCVGMVDTPELAAEIVSALTRADETHARCRGGVESYGLRLSCE